MPLEEFTDVTGSPTWFNSDEGKIYTQGGTNPTEYTSIAEWNARQQDAHPEMIAGAGNANPEGPSNASTGFTSTQPTLNLNELYESITNTPEINQIKSEVEAKKAALTKATTDINDNPWYSEATRLGKISKLNATAQSELRDLEDKLATRMADAQTKINIATQQYNIDSQEYQNSLSRLNLLISSGALSNASANDIAQIGIATGLSSSMLRGIQNKMAQDAKNLQVQTNVDDNGVATVSIIDLNTMQLEGSISLGKVGKATKQAGAGNPFKPGTPTYIAAINAMSQDMQSVSGADRHVSPDAFLEYRSQWVQAGGDATDFDKAFKGYINPIHAQDYLVGYSSSQSREAALKALFE